MENMKNRSVALMIYGDLHSGRNALTEEKYKDLATAFTEKGFQVESVVYNDAMADQLAGELMRFDAILVWVNPIEQGNNRKILDALLTGLAVQGCFVSAHPEVITRMGTKDILYKTRGTEFGGDIKLYHSFEDFKKRFPDPAFPTGTRILKQYRGNGGNGVFKIDLAQIRDNRIGVTHAKTGEEEKFFAAGDFFEEFRTYFEKDGILIDQPWNPGIINGMVRCYLTGTRVTGFGYQEVNALYPGKGAGLKAKPPGKRYYFSEDCGLFRDLKNIMEKKWVPQIQEIAGVDDTMMPVIWDADFFINTINTEDTSGKYTLCEINVSCVSPFPGSAVPYMVQEVANRIDRDKG